MLLSLVVGQIVTRIGDMLGTPVARQLITVLGGVDELTKAFVAVELSFIAVFAAAYGISSTLRLVGEESAMRADLILSTPTGRMRWALSHLVMAVVGTGILMLASGLGIGLAHAVESGDRSLRRSAGRGRPAAGRLGAGRREPRPVRALPPCGPDRVGRARRDLPGQRDRTAPGSAALGA